VIRDCEEYIGLCTGAIRADISASVSGSLMSSKYL